MFIDQTQSLIRKRENLFWVISITFCLAMGAAPNTAVAQDQTDIGIEQQQEFPEEPPFEEPQEPVEPTEPTFEEEPEPIEPSVPTIDVGPSSYEKPERESAREERRSSVSGTAAPIVNRILKDAQRCERFPWVYRYDCLQWVFKDASKVRTQNASQMREARQILARASTKMDAVVRANLDPVQPPSRIGNRQIRAVKQSSRAEVDAATREIVQETETLLLRSGDTQQKQAEYTKIAEAVSSTEILLRSALETLHRFAAVYLPFHGRLG